jgi:hypothetical protein
LCASACVVVVAAATAAIIVASNDPTTFEQIAMSPERYRNQDVQLVGRVASRPMPPRNGFVLTGPQGRRVLVVPESGVDVPSVPVGHDAAVHGTVVPIEPWADDIVEDYPRGAGTVGELAVREDAAALVKAITIREAT